MRFSFFTMVAAAALQAALNTAIPLVNHEFKEYKPNNKPVNAIAPDSSQASLQPEVELKSEKEVSAFAEPCKSAYPEIEIKN